MNKKTWEEFRETGLLLFINQLLHIFGWAIAMEITEDNTIKDIYPARVKFRGFNIDSTDKAYKKITKYMSDNIEDIKNDLDNE